MADSAPVLLVVDDHPDMRLLLTTVLEMEGQRVVTATNGMEAFDLARRHRPWLIVLDLMMPVMTGEEFREAQLANEEIRDIPVVVVSAHHDAQAIARRMNATWCLTKPLDLDALMQLVSSAGRSSSAASRAGEADGR